ncbi:hypothetical protein LC612_38460, partial [Nostoc sp. CHAB 5834]|nr:hypothetical protein [Nostoc sp. CHAB 5834]
IGTNIGGLSSMIYDEYLFDMSNPKNLRHVINKFVTNNIDSKNYQRKIHLTSNAITTILLKIYQTSIIKLNKTIIY